MSRRLAMSTLVGIVALCAAAAGCRSPDAEGATDTSAISRPLVLGPQDVAIARVQPIDAGVTITGSLVPAQSVTLTAQVAGTITNVRVNRGSPVSRGQLMAVIDAQGVRSEAAGARANVAAAQANVALARQRAEASRALHEAGAISAIEYQSQRAALDAAQAQLAAARAQAAGAAEQAARTNITAPLSGIVSDRQVESGEAVSVGGELFTIVDASTLELSAQVPVDEAARVQVGHTVVFTLTADPSRELRGRVARIDPAADPATRQVGVYTQLPNPGNRIIGGQFARGRVVGQRVQEAIVIPESAVRVTAGERTVLVIEDGRIARRVVTVGARDERAGVVEVLSGVRAGEQVLTVPSGSIAEGATVVVTGDAGVPAVRPGQ